MNGINSYADAIERVVYTADEIKVAVSRVAREIAADHAGQPLMLVGVLKGALYALADLARAIAQVPDGPSGILVDHVCLSSYGNAARTSGEVRMLKDTSMPVAGQNVVIVEDIVDNGLTLAYLQALLRGRAPARLRSFVLFDKPYHRQRNVPIEYVGLRSPDEFVVGYGLDYQELFRNLPYLAQLRAQVFSQEG